jgi:adenylate cyclase
MSDAADELPAWLLDPDTAALEPPALLDGLVARLSAAGVALHRVSIWIPTKHPELWGNQLTWDRADGARVLRRSHEVSSTVDYVGTPSEALHQSGGATLRCRLDREPERSRFAMLAAMADGGATDYFMASLDPGEAGAAWASFTSAAPGGFTDAQLALLAGLTPLLALHVRLAAGRFATRSLLEVYLGGNAARRVLAGEFRRGTGSELDAALWFCDMRGFTALGDRLSARAVVGLLDQYFEHLATPIEEHGGEILKFIGDAILAVFPIGEAGAPAACRGALAAAEAGLARIHAWSREAPERVAVGVALHLGRVMYGNVGGRTRLDFTVIGASVNEVCRVESMCKTLGQPLLLTAAFTGALAEPDIVSLGHHSLRGVAQPQELFTVRRGG